MVWELFREAVPASDRTSDHGIINFHTAGRLRCVISDILHKLGYHYEVSVIPDLDLFYWMEFVVINIPVFFELFSDRESIYRDLRCIQRRPESPQQYRSYPWYDLRTLQHRNNAGRDCFRVIVFYVRHFNAPFFRKARSFGGVFSTIKLWH